MKRNLYPSSKRDRWQFWGTILIIVPGTLLATYMGDYWLVAIGVLGLLAGVMNVYLLQDQPSEGRGDEYSAVISQIKGIEEQLADLNAFLERERKRVADTEGTLVKLQQERASLEPIVLTQRETVEAILAAHSSKTASNAWKERIIGFVLGALASLMAAMIYDWLIR